MRVRTSLHGFVAGAIVLAAGLTAAADEKAPPPVRVLFIGNSQVYYNHLPKILEGIAESAPKGRPRVLADGKPSDRSVAGGATLESHWKRGTGEGTGRGKIASEKWDFVVLQDFPVKTSKEEFARDARLFNDLIEKNGAKAVLLGIAHFPNQVPRGFQEVHERYVSVAKDLKVPIAAGGMAWLAYWGEKPTPEQVLDLYDKDKGHPGPKGSYLYACTLYAAVTGQSPEGLTHRIPGQPADALTPAEAKRMQEAAWKVHRKVNGK